MPGIGPGRQPPLPAGSVDPDDDLFAEFFDVGDGEGAIILTWEQASRCPCTTADTHQPRVDCPRCLGVGVLYEPARQVTGLFRDQSRWLSFRREGELAHGEARLTTPLAVKPGYTDRRVRDRITVLGTQEDPAEGRVFYPAAPPTPFLFNQIQRAWRTQLQSADTSQINP